MPAPVILSRPAFLPDPIGSVDWFGMSVTWEGWDGSVWDLNDFAGGVLLYREGVEGLHFPRISRYTSRSRAIPGNRLRGWRAEERSVFWPIFVWGDGSEAWRLRNEAFMRTIHPDRAGTWRVKVGSQVRSLKLTGTFDEPHLFGVDPLMRGWEKYGVTLEAAQPFWEGEKIIRGPWLAPASESFIPASGAPPFYISAGSTFGSATIPNPGDVPVWGVWRMEGPLTGVEVGVGSTLVHVPFDITAGEVLLIDTDPRHPTATLDGADVTTALGLQDYASVPPGAEVSLHVEATGAGSAQFELTPLYFRAF